MNINVLILESAVRRRRFRFFKTKNLFDFRELTFSFDVLHNALLRALNYFDYDMHSFISFSYNHFKTTIDWLYDL